VFDVIYLLTQGGPGVDTTVLSYKVYADFTTNNLGESSAFGVILFVVVFVISALVWSARRRVVKVEE